MPEYLAPGVYVEEIDSGNKPIEGVSTSTAGFFGETERGPLRPTLVLSFAEFVRTFGGYVDDLHMARGVEGFFQNGGRRCFVMRVVGKNAASSQLVIGSTTMNAVGPGMAGNRIAIKISDATSADPANPGQPNPNLFKLTVIYWAPNVTIDPNNLVDPTDPANRTDPNRRDPTVLEIYDNLSAISTSSSFCERQINGMSTLIEIDQADATRPVNTALTLLDQGTDGAAVALDDYLGVPGSNPGEGRGLAALEEVDEISILVCPDEHKSGFQSGDVADGMLGQCERLMDRVAILQAPQSAGAISAHYPSRASTRGYGAYYFPWLEITNPTTGTNIFVPPGGHVAGIYARSDVQRGVHKAPANEVVRGISGLQLQVSKGHQEILNPRGVNCLREFPGRGFLVWGGRTNSTDPAWRYINVRRLFNFIEESIDEATQWVVFEPNDQNLWARVTRAVSDFLQRLWRDGMLMGATAQEAYFVRCDRTTMTQADIDTGRLIMVIGIAPVKPAEFVIFRIGQWSGGSEVSEL